ncbi:MAG: metallopeptidase TldD-related protein [Clostridia bacterium]|nr:metallopeptidase TldD-related protein [Clostridia bacterium]MDY2901009.1 metallopeptidase TldD-related protein [Christensenellaceae bacterium]
MNNRIELLKKLLEENKTVSDYRINRTGRTSSELFFVHRNLETSRATDVCDMNVTVYVDHDGKKGESSFAVYESMTETDLRLKIAEAAERAKLVFNEPYEIPCGEKTEREVPSNFKNYEPKELAAKIAEAAFKADNYENGSINALEVFVNKFEITVVNSKGVDVTEVKYNAMVEAIPTWNENGESVELYEAYRFTEFDADEITAEIDEKMKEVRDRKHAVKPAEKIEADVVLNVKEAGELFSELANDLTFASVYSHYNLHKIGDDLQNGDGDKITLEMKGAMKGSEYSAAFDADGVSLADKKIISGGKVEGYFGTNRFASYLGEKPTGNLQCVSVEKGSLTDKELGEKPCLECVSLSGLQIDLYNDYIGGEIRLAYYRHDGVAEPVTGISMSGKLSEVLAEIRLSDKTKVRGYYGGPYKVLLKGMEII